MIGGYYVNSTGYKFSTILSFDTSLNLKYAQAYFLDKYGASLYGVWDIDSYYDASPTTDYPFVHFACAQVINSNTLMIRMRATANFSTFSGSTFYHG